MSVLSDLWPVIEVSVTQLGQQSKLHSVAVIQETLPPICRVASGSNDLLLGVNTLGNDLRTNIISVYCTYEGSKHKRDLLEEFFKKIFLELNRLMKSMDWGLGQCSSCFLFSLFDNLIYGDRKNMFFQILLVTQLRRYKVELFKQISYSGTRRSIIYLLN